MPELENTLTPEELEEQQINQAFQKLLDAYLASNHRKKVDIITRAFNFAKQAHKGVRRRSGEPYIFHPIAVARIACEEIGLGSTSICAALLHDVVEDTEYTFEDIQNLFGTKIANIVEGLTKIAGGIFGERASLQAETFKKLLLTMSEDIRVILIKISDRLHNMRTLSSMLPSKQYKIAGETLYIYAPIAGRLGLNRIKNELEDLSFRYEHPDDYKLISEKLASTQAERDSVFREFTEPIRTALDKLGLTYTIEARIKTPYSIWKKMQDKHVTFEEIFDILATRIIFEPKEGEEEVNTCFNIYVALTKLYTNHPDRTRDWVNHPKANGYQALHVTLMNTHGEWIEVQIRSHRMQDIAEQGVAAHWKYKSTAGQGDTTTDEGTSKMDGWIHTIKEILDDPQPDTLDLLDTIKLNLFASEIIVFTPKGEIKTMPAGATALDFAFSIHSFLGTNCIGAKVNHRLVPATETLNSGDQIEILTSRQQQVKREWLDFVTTAKAKSKIQACLRKMDREKQAQAERQIRDFLTTKSIEYNPTILDKLRILHQRPTAARFLLDIADGIITLGDNDISYLRGKGKGGNSFRWRSLIPFVKGSDSTKNEGSDGLLPASIVNGQLTTVNDESFIKSINRKKTLTIDEEVIKHCKVATCCKPIPGDDALGYIDEAAHTLTIHKRECEEATRLKSRHGDNIVAVRWDMQHGHLFETTLHVEGADKMGTLFRIAESLFKHSGLDVTGLNIQTERGLFHADLTVLVHDTKEVADLCQDLRKIEAILKAVRI
ncbi:MAG: bifunctional (p)ppGpp synthetase/guanosine-3',5'-bis(diphosphate) 3'-pyrophosphohydrolase [Bacteroidaceae bacterium]|nr:bifunctional (p)ppGpp synthetase/guanosine-3',5'-bis(diphosphate) 3'-pyrophosphohydrolase [Bacteroidaceae bacterium]MBR4782408.1 bifunctional (p)ppGpp synthetase/guanosine-3',5'-bis(diphosphate) 3'-pyrophosphohydrolase [Bacteroidaceae bacterium]